jgi:cyclohexanone monooxygenase
MVGQAGNGAERTSVDVVIVGAGFAGLYAIHKMREIGRTAVAIERGDGVGGTWYWNRYPGLRCDNPSVDYSYSFSRELEQEWRWAERYGTQEEILRYLNHVADRFDLRRDIEFETTVEAAHYDDERQRWSVSTDTGKTFDAQFCIMASGGLSAYFRPPFPGLDGFRGEWHHTARWPQDREVDFTGKRVGLIGTGSTGVQISMEIAKTAEHLTVFQRTPNFVIPAGNRPLSDEELDEIKATYPQRREESRRSGLGEPKYPQPISAMAVSDEERLEEYEGRWKIGGGSTVLTAYEDLLANQDSNDTIANFVRDKIRDVVKDPEVAERLTPRDHPLGTKRICIADAYYPIYNQPNVSLVDVRAAPIQEVVPEGIRTTEGTHELDMIIFATGFDALTGALLEIDIRGRDGASLAEVWADGPRTYLGVATQGFPNMFLITGPQSPSVFSNVVVSIEQHVEWVSDLLAYMGQNGFDRVDVDPAKQDEWVEHVAEVASGTLFPLANSWYMGSNIPGKARVLLPYLGGVGAYRARCEEIAENGYEGFVLERSGVTEQKVGA